MRRITRNAVFAFLFVIQGAGCDLILGQIGENPNIPGGDNLPNFSEVSDARARLEAALAGVEQAREALELLGLLPVYECGEPRRTFVGSLVDQLTLEIPCATITSDPVGDTGDVITLSFPQGGCEVLGHTLSGTLSFFYSGGEDRLDLTMDATGLFVDGKNLQVVAGYGTCGDETSIFAAAAGDLQNPPGTSFDFDIEVSKRDGPPIIGGTTLILDGSGEVSNSGGTNSITLTEVEYELGDFLPKSGTITISTSTGHTISATFDLDSPLLGSVTVVIDDHDPVRIPVILP